MLTVIIIFDNSCEMFRVQRLNRRIIALALLSIVYLRIHL